MQGGESGDTLSLAPGPATEEPSVVSAGLRRAVAKLVLETTSEGVWLIDARSVTTFVNARTAALLGYSVEEMLGAHLFAFMDEEGKRICDANLARRQSGVTEQHEFKFRRKDGTFLWTLLATNPVYDKRGDYAGALAMVGDLTEHKLRERALAQRVQELEALVDARTREAAEARARLQALEAAAPPLTGFENRRCFDERLQAEVDRSLRYRRRFCLMVIHLERLGDVERRFGRPVRDALIHNIGAALAGVPVGAGPRLRQLRTVDFIATYGADMDGRFVVFAPETKLEGCVTLAERVVDLIWSARVPTVGGPAASVHASIGVANFPYHARTAAQLVAAAEVGLVDARRAGGGRVCLAVAPEEEG